MKKCIKNLIFLLVLSLNFQCAFCYVLDYAALEDAVKNQILAETKDDILQYSSDFDINIQGIPKNPTVTNEEVKPKIDVVSQNSAFSINSYKRVMIKDSKNNVVRSFPINVQTRIFKEVLCANTVIPFGSEVNAQNTTVMRKEISRYLNKTLDKSDNPFVASKNYSKGAIITQSQTEAKAKAIVAKNSNVDIVFVSQKGLRITLQGKALKDGAMGDTIPVRSNKYNKTYNATINSSKEVTVRI